jgi:hypothetical protein
MAQHSPIEVRRMETSDGWGDFTLRTSHMSCIPVGGPVLNIRQREKEWISFDTRFAAELWPILKRFAETGRIDGEPSVEPTTFY